jgi:DMSO/TMAO reductase YedYZ molybdopterin-dependent catalytic subunit
MPEPLVTRGFVGRRRSPERGQRLPPGQYLTDDFPVLSAGPTPRTSLKDWTFSREFVVDISCVTKWTHLDMRWQGVSIDTLLEHVQLEPKAAFVIEFSDGGYTTNLPIADVVNDQAFIAYGYDGQPLAPEHGGPARMVVPHLYFWKSAKWIRGLRIVERDTPGFWEGFGYHNRGDPWLEERYSGD